MDERLSRTFQLLRFPLAVWVVVIHSGWSEVLINGVTYGQGELPVYRALSHFLCISAGGIVVPTFLFISGFLFFREGSFSRDAYAKKLKNRFRSLVIPYILWNIGVLVFQFAYQTVLASRGYVFGSTRPVIEYDVIDFLRSFWDVKSGSPICFQMWYVRDLIILTFISPVIWLLLTCFRKLGGLFLLIILFVVYLTCWPSFPPKMSSVLYFVWGAYFSIYHIKLIDGFSSVFTRCLWGYPIVLLVLSCTGNMHLLMASWPIGVLFLINFVYKFGRSDESLSDVRKYLAGISFFLYCLHEPLLTILRKISYLLVKPATDFSFILIWLVNVVMVVAIAIGLSMFLKKQMAWLWWLLNGR